MPNFPICVVDFTAWRLRCPQIACAQQPRRCHGLDGLDVSALAADLRLMNDTGVTKRIHFPVGFTRTTTSPSFIMAVALIEDWDKKDVSEVSFFIGWDGAHERQYTALWRRLTQKCCATAGGVVLDVGANLGYYALYAARLGCRVMAWEPIPLFGAFLRASAAINGLSHRIDVRRAVASDQAGTSHTMLVPRNGWDVSSVGGLNQAGVSNPTWRAVRAIAERLDDVVLGEPRVCALKLDTEGFEPAVIRGAHRLLRTSPPHAVLVEYNPGAVERRMATGHAGATAGPDVSYRDFPRMLQTLHSNGLRLWQLDEIAKHQAHPPGKPFQLRAVDARSISAELAGARHVSRVYAAGGVAIPWDVHPYSLRASFAYNTDLIGVLHSIDASHTITSVGRVGVGPNSSRALGGVACNKLSGATQRMGLCNADDATIERAARIAEAPGSASGWHELFPTATPFSWGQAHGTGKMCWWFGGCLLPKGGRVSALLPSKVGAKAVERVVARVRRTGERRRTLSERLSERLAG